MDESLTKLLFSPKAIRITVDQLLFPTLDVSIHFEGRLFAIKF